MPCAEEQRLQAYFDGELDALGSAELEHHVERCEACQQSLEELEHTRLALRALPQPTASSALRARVLGALNPKVSETTYKREPRGFWPGLLTGVGITLAASLAWLWWIPALSLSDELVAAHVRSLMSTHVIDVVSTDRHTVKPWFAGHADVSPYVADFEAQGYKLLGGRADYLNHQRAAVLIYQHGAHTIDVFSWASDRHSAPRKATVDGYHLISWQVGTLSYCAISDTGWEELRSLVQLLQTGSARED